MRRSPHPVTLRQLQYVVAVADRRSFRRAAADCHVSQPSLSAQIALVEDLLAVRLFERDPRSVSLTAAGEAFVAEARALLLGADALFERARTLADPLKGSLPNEPSPPTRPTSCLDCHQRDRRVQCGAGLGDLVDLDHRPRSEREGWSSGRRPSVQ